MSGVEDQAFVTLATNDTYALGALVLGHSLRRVGTTRKLVCMITQGVTQGIREQLASVFNNVVIVNVFDSNDTANLALLTRPDLGVTFTKLHCWRLTQFTKCVFLDADTLVLHNVDELFEREELSAAPDVGWPDCFNSGVFVFRPSEETYNALVHMAVTTGSFDGGDQGLLNMYFSDWATKDIARHLPFIYNVVSTTFYSYAPAFQYYGRGTKIVHFIGAQKPWHHVYNTATRQVEGSSSGQSKDFLQLWWDLFMSEVQPCLDPTLMGLVGELASLRIEHSGHFTEEELHDRERQYQWERGQIDYLGKDSFSLIQKRIDRVIEHPEEVAASAAAPAPAKPAAARQAPPVAAAPKKGILAKPKTKPAQ